MSLGVVGLLVAVLTGSAAAGATGTKRLGGAAVKIWPPDKNLTGGVLVGNLRVCSIEVCGLLYGTSGLFGIGISSVVLKCLVESRAGDFGGATGVLEAEDISAVFVFVSASKRFCSNSLK